MGNKHLLQMVLTVCWCGLVVPARGGAPQVVFDGYSARAEAAVERMLRGVSRLKTYADDAVIKMEMGAALQQPEMVMSVVYEAPHRFHIRTMVHEVVSDGRTLSVYMKQSRRYKVEPLERDVGEQIGQYVGALGLDFGVAELLVSEDPRKAFADTFKGLDVTGLESIDGDRCLVLEGVMGEALMNMAGADVPATLYIRERDMMLRRLELDLLEGVKEQFEGAEALSGMLEEYRLVYDVRGLVVNKPLERDAFSFEPPEGAKKVDQFHSMWLHVGRSAAQFELSGKPAPDFSLETTDGDVFALSAERGRVVVLHFVWSQFGFQDPSIRKLETIRREFESKGVVFVSIFPGANADKLLERRREDGVEMRVVLDPDRVAVDAYFNERYAMGIVLVDKQGIVQGRYRMLQQKNTDQYLRDDLEKLLAGKGLAGGKVMSEAEIREAQEQRAAVFTGASASDPINEADLHEAWSVRTRASGTFGFGGGAARRPGGELWSALTLRPDALPEQKSCTPSIPAWPRAWVWMI